MEDSIKVSKGIEEAKEMVENLEKTVTELKSRREASLPNNTQWVDIKEHLDNLEKSLKEKLDEIEEKERTLEEKQSGARNSVTEREATVAAKELSSLDCLQEQKDSAVSAIEEARKNCKSPAPVLSNVKGTKEDKVSTSTIDEPTAPIAAKENVSDNKSGDLAKAVASEETLRPQLKKLCEQMDTKGLLKILSDNRKFLNTISGEVSVALKSASEPALLVLDSLEGFYPPLNSEGIDENALQILRRACLVLLEAAPSVLGNDIPMSYEIKQQAKAIADEWKSKLAGIDIDVSNGYSLEAVAFLQLLVSFGIAEEFHEDELCKLVLAVSRRRQAAGLCRSLGLTHRMPGVVETLVKSGRQIDAVHFAYAFQLTESFPPVTLLKEHLKNVMANTQEITGDAAKQKDAANNREMGALRVIIKCIEEYKLQDEYPIEPLKKRVSQLEKAKYDKKRSVQQQQQQAPKHPSKKPRTNSNTNTNTNANGGYPLRKPTMPPPAIYEDRGAYPHFPESRYNYSAPPAYEAITAQRPYHYPTERVAPLALYSTFVNYGSTNYASPGYNPNPTAPSYTGAGYPYSSTANDYGNYLGTSVQSVSSNYGTYLGTPGASHPPY